MGSAKDIARVGLAITTVGTSLALEGALGGKKVKEGVVDEPKEARRRAEEAANEQRRSAENLASEAETRRVNEEGAANAEATAQAARKRQRSLAAGNQGRRSTILTGPLGIVDDTPVARKSILGA